MSAPKLLVTDADFATDDNPTTNTFAVGSSSQLVSTEDTTSNWWQKSDGTWQFSGLSGGPGSGPGTFMSYTPVLTGTSTNPGLGSTGTLVGEYTLIGDICTGTVTATFGGTGISGGSGQYVVTVPVTADSSRVGKTVGDGSVKDNSTGNIYTRDVVLSTSTTAVLSDQPGVIVGNNVPMTAATGDVYTWNFSYRIALGMGTSGTPSPGMTLASLVTAMRDLSDATFKSAIDAEIALGAGSGAGLDSVYQASNPVFGGGTVGDGTADDYAAIASAVSACSTAGGGVVYLGEGTFNISASIVLPSNVELRGAGRSVTIIRPHSTGSYTYSLIRNYRATQSSGSNDTDIAVRDLCLDGRSTGNSDDSRRGYGIELYGSTRATIERVKLTNIPLSGIEVSGNFAAVAGNSVTSGTPPNAQTIDTTIRDVTGQHIGWQEPFLSGTPLTQWGDAGFGIIGRSNVRGLTIENCKMRDCEVNGIGVGQMDSQNNTADPPTAAHCADVQITNCLVDQSTASGTVSAPSFRIAFTARATLTNCIAVGNANSVGFNVRAAGTSFTRRVTLVGCISENNVAGFQVTGKDAVTASQHVTLSACVAKGNTSEGFRTQNAHVALAGCHSVSNGTHGFWLQYVSGASITSVFDSTVTGCHAKDNGTSGTNYGFLLDGCSAVVISGCLAADTRSGGSRTQSYGLREINSAGANAISGTILRNHPTANIGTLGSGSVSTGNITT